MAELGMAFVDVGRFLIQLAFVILAAMILIRTAVDYYFLKKREMLSALGLNPCKEGSNHG